MWFELSRVSRVEVGLSLCAPSLRSPAPRRSLPLVHQPDSFLFSSMGAQGSKQEGAGGQAPEQAADYYTLLEVSEDATQEEIRVGESGAPSMATSRKCDDDIRSGLN